MLDIVTIHVCRAKVPVLAAVLWLQFKGSQIILALRPDVIDDLQGTSYRSSSVVRGGGGGR